MKLDIVFTGVGGQGVVVLSDIFCEAALLEGFDVAKAEIHGMAQRGGSISAFVRLGDKVISPLIEHGKSDILMGFEILETTRALPMLRPHGTVVFNKKYIPPASILRARNKPLQPNELIALIKEKAKNVYEVDGSNIAKK